MIRSIAPTELSAWAALDDRADHFLERSITDLVARDASRPDWCLLAETDGRPIGRLGVVAEQPAGLDNPAIQL